MGTFRPTSVKCRAGTAGGVRLAGMASSGELRLIAAQEAAECPLRESSVPYVEAALAAAARRYPSQDPLDQRIPIPGDSWAQIAAHLPGALATAGAVTRRDLFALAEQVRFGEASLLALFDAVYAFGWGEKSLGLARYTAIMQATTPTGLEERLTRAWQLLATGDVFGAYSWLYGGTLHKNRARPGAAGRGRVRDWGPAFFTKFLYVAAPAGGPTVLILDEKLAARVKALSGMQHLVTERGKVKDWTPHRYSVYCAWMGQTAARYEVAPDWLELALFRHSAVQ